MPGGLTLKIETEYITAPIPPPSTKHERFASLRGSEKLTGDDSINKQRVRTALGQRHVHQSNVDPSGGYSRLKTAHSRLSVDVQPFLKSLQPQKPRKSKATKILDSSTDDDDINAGHYSDDWDSDCSDDRRFRRVAVPQPEARLLPSDSAAFGVSICSQRQSAIDNMSYRRAVDSWKPKTLPGLVKLITDLSSGKCLLDRAWMIFYWISQNIAYDNEACVSGHIRYQSATDFFRSRKGVCGAFANIFEGLCTAAKIECKTISGCAKGVGYTLERKSFDRANHAWNAVRLEAHWYLIDSTWGRGSLESGKSSRKQLDSFYFLARPEQMIYKHLPEDSQWQLLTTPISMSDFVGLPHVESTFFELSVVLIHPPSSNTASYDAKLQLAEVLVQTPPDVILMGAIEPKGAEKTEHGSLVQYDVGRQLWQCLFAPQRGGFHTLRVYARRLKQNGTRETNKESYSAALEFSLNAPTGIIKPRTLPTTYGVFTERHCQIFEPIEGILKAGSTVTIHYRIPGVHCARLLLDGDWLEEDPVNNDTFRRKMTVPQREVIVYVQFADKKNTSSYDGLVRYSVE